METILKALNERQEARLQVIAEEQKSGKPLVMYNGSFVPEELIRASGANACLLCHGGDREAAEAALDYTVECINPLARSYIGNIIAGRYPLTDSADLLVMAFADNHIGRMSELLEYKNVNVCKIGVPPDWQKKIAFDYYLNGLKKMLNRVETLTGHAADQALAAQYFARANRVNGAFRRINAARMGDNVPIGIEDMLRLHHLSFVLNGEEDVRMFETLAEKLEQAAPRFDPKAPRLLLMGRAVAVGDYKILRMLDESGCPVVAEILDEGVRVLDADVDPEGDLLTGFAVSRFSKHLPIDMFQPSWKIRFDHLSRLLEEYRIDGVVWYQLAHDEVYDMEYSCVAKWLKECRMPLVRIETDYDYSTDKTAARKRRLNSFLKAAKEHRKTERNV